ncbi:hypothetical protein TNCV_3535171 [Trichonephila clavipes]|nr:hypothetical protein TNCV_3535171 [Trichonephila clavipes]
MTMMSIFDAVLERGVRSHPPEEGKELFTFPSGREVLDPGVGEVHLPVVSSGVLGTDDYHSVRMDGMISHQRKANSNADAARRQYLGLSRSAESRANSRGNKHGK